jgi:probable rRNA maturation factor
MKKMKVHVIQKSRRQILSARQLQSRVNRIVKWLLPKLPLKPRHLLRRRSQLVLVFVDRSEGQALNLTYRKKNYATDVLSFAPIEDDFLGELVFCTPVLVNQSREHGLSLEDELIYMLIHGLLHLLGYEHEKNKAQARQMFRLQDQIFDLWRS